MDMSKYNKLQALRAKLSEAEEALENLAMSARDLPYNSKQRQILRVQYRIQNQGVNFYKDAVASLVKEVSVDY